MYTVFSRHHPNGFANSAWFGLKGEGVVREGLFKLKFYNNNYAVI